MRELDIRMIPISSDEMDRLLDESKVEIGVNCGDETANQPEESDRHIRYCPI